jgi:prepilin-type N-terminal cleavage/methylation domain-containing protein
VTSAQNRISTYRRRSNSGLTLLELLITVAIISVLMMGVSRAYVAGIDYDTRMRDGRAEAARIQAFEDRMTELIKHAHLSEDANQTASYFIGSVGNGQDAQGTVTGGEADTLIFTVAGLRVRGSLLDATEEFEELNQKYGPQGGIAELAISTIPVGSAADRSGVFLREQRPADGDPTQGGYESLMQPGVESMKFEFFDGTQWQTSWDTREMTTKRLPAAVRVTYRLETEANDRTLTVRVPASDVTVQNPVTTETSQ